MQELFSYQGKRIFKLREKKLILIRASLLPLLLNCLVSFTPSNQLTMKLYSFTEFTNLKTNETKSGAGHTFIVFYNNTNSSYTIGNYVLHPSNTVSIGLWNKGSGADSSNGSSSGSSSGGLQYAGVHCNQECYFYNFKENMANAVNIEISVKIEKLSKINEKINEKNDNYNLIRYNCSTFATDIWNIAAEKSWYTGWFRKPVNVMDDIKKDDSNRTYDNTLPKSKTVGHYDKNYNIFHYIEHLE